MRLVRAAATGGSRDGRLLRRILWIAIVVGLVVSFAGLASAYWRASGDGTGGAANPNLFAVRLGSLSLDTAQGTGGFAVAGAAGCTVALATLTFTTQTAGWTVSGNGTLPITLTDALAMGTGATNACQGASFTVYQAAGSDREDLSPPA
jgi:hypothetical protein